MHRDRRSGEARAGARTPAAARRAGHPGSRQAPGLRPAGARGTRPTRAPRRRQAAAEATRPSAMEFATSVAWVLGGYAESARVFAARYADASHAPPVPVKNSVCLTERPFTRQLQSMTRYPTQGLPLT